MDGAERDFHSSHLARGLVVDTGAQSILAMRDIDVRVELHAGRLEDLPDVRHDVQRDAACLLGSQLSGFQASGRNAKPGCRVSRAYSSGPGVCSGEHQVIAASPKSSGWQPNASDHFALSKPW